MSGILYILYEARSGAPGLVPKAPQREVRRALTSGGESRVEVRRVVHWAPEMQFSLEQNTSGRDIHIRQSVARIQHPRNVCRVRTPCRNTTTFLGLFLHCRCSPEKRNRTKGANYKSKVLSPAAMVSRKKKARPVAKTLGRRYEGPTTRDSRVGFQENFCIPPPKMGVRKK